MKKDRTRKIDNCMKEEEQKAIIEGQKKGRRKDEKKGEEEKKERQKSREKRKLTKGKGDKVRRLIYE